MFVGCFREVCGRLAEACGMFAEACGMFAGDLRDVCGIFAGSLPRLAVQQRFAGNPTSKALMCMVSRVQTSKKGQKSSNIF